MFERFLTRGVNPRQLILDTGLTGKEYHSIFKKDIDYAMFLLSNAIDQEHLEDVHIALKQVELNAKR